MQATILCVIGTRPEVIKMAPVIHALQTAPWARVRIIATAQHREMLDDAMRLFGLRADTDLGIMQPGQSLPELTARLLTAMDQTLATENPAAIIAQGDTTTVMATALAAFYRQVPFFHVEAGLRTGDLQNPFPEEMNRIVAGRLATLHFAPTDSARNNLLAEGIAPVSVFVTGNTVIDALHGIAKKDMPLPFELPRERRLILLTAHRRENFGTPLTEIFGAVRDLSARHPELHFVYPVHPNPHVSRLAHEMLADAAGVTLCPPLDYGQMASLLKRCWLVLTDSGGLQEEAPALGKPVLVLRRQTERPEAVAAGCARLIGTERNTIITAVEALLTNAADYTAMARTISPYGDGYAASRIVAIVRDFLFPETPAQQ